MLNDVVIANKTYTKLLVAAGEQLDDIALKVIKQDLPEFLLPIKSMDIDGDTEIRYEIVDGLRLEYFSNSMTKKEFVTLLSSMLMPFKICNDWFLDYHNILLDKKYILVGKKQNTVKYVYIPSAKYGHTDEQIMKFFQDFILNMNITDDSVYVMDLYRRAVKDGANLMSILDYISKDIDKAPQKDEREKSVTAEPVSVPVSMPTPPPTPTPASTPAKNPAAGLFGKKEEPKVEEKKPESSGNDYVSQGLRPGQDFGKDNKAAEIGKFLFDDADEDSAKEKKPKKEPAVKDKAAKGSLLGGLFGGKAKPKEEVVQVSSPSAAPVKPTENMQRNWVEPPTNTGDDATDILGEEVVTVNENRLTLQLEDAAGYNCPKVIEIDLSRGFATVGRFDKSGAPQSDFNFDASLSFISRKHFRVEKNGDQRCIVDLNSANGTSLNGQAIVANMPYPIQPGDKIAISNRHRITYRVC